MLKETDENGEKLAMEKVLILILMEHAQRVLKILSNIVLYTSLNPYFNGTCSKSEVQKGARRAMTVCLNPYFNGTCSKREMANCYIHPSNSLNPYFNGTCSKSPSLHLLMQFGRQS